MWRTKFGFAKLCNHLYSSCNAQGSFCESFTKSCWQTRANSSKPDRTGEGAFNLTINVFPPQLRWNRATLRSIWQEDNIKIDWTHQPIRSRGEKTGFSHQETEGGTQGRGLIRFYKCPADDDETPVWVANRKWVGNASTPPREETRPGTNRSNSLVSAAAVSRTQVGSCWRSGVRTSQSVSNVHLYLILQLKSWQTFIRHESALRSFLHCELRASSLFFINLFLPLA